jgi:hypothetical protein
MISLLFAKENGRFFLPLKYGIVYRFVFIGRVSSSSFHCAYAPRFSFCFVFFLFFFFFFFLFVSIPYACTQDVTVNGAANHKRNKTSAVMLPTLWNWFWRR